MDDTGIPFRWLVMLGCVVKNITSSPCFIAIQSMILGLLDRMRRYRALVVVCCLCEFRISSLTGWKPDAMTEGLYPLANSNALNRLDYENIFQRNMIFDTMPLESSCTFSSNWSFSTIRLNVPFFRSIIPIFLWRLTGRDFSLIPLLARNYLFLVCSIRRLLTSSFDLRVRLAIVGPVP